VRIHRDLCNHPIWLQEEFTRGQAWVDMIMLAKFEPGYVRKRGIRINLRIGQLAYSKRTLAERWKWSLGKLNRFLTELEQDGHIEVVSTNVSSTITIKNYDYWQEKGLKNESPDGLPKPGPISGRGDGSNISRSEPPNGDLTNDQTETKRTPFNNDKKAKNGKKGDDTPSDVQRLFEYFIGEVNYRGQHPTAKQREMLETALQVMPPEDWKPYCDERLRQQRDGKKVEVMRFFFESDYLKYQLSAEDGSETKCIRRCPECEEWYLEIPEGVENCLKCGTDFCEEIL
ncbi:MAG: hypothetical protein V3U24_04190, partial [Candidatus Neomarinimicrobiota bacterium]